MGNNDKDNKNNATLRAIASMAQNPMFIYEHGAKSLLLKYQSFLDNATISDEIAKQALEKNKKDCSVKFFDSKNEIYEGVFSGDFSGKIKSDSIAVVPVMGAMMRDDYCDMALNFVAGTRSLERTISSLDKNQNINAIVLHVVTPGGQAMGNESLSNVIKDSKTPVLVYFEMMASAGVYSFQGADEIYGAENDSLWGSIGTYITLVDNSKMLESLGYNIKEIYATDSTEKNIEYREALNGNEEPMVEWLDKSNKDFINHVKKVRPSIQDDGKVFKGKIYTAKEAKKIGAIDGIGSADFVLNRARILGNKYKKKHTKDAKDSKGKNNLIKNDTVMADENSNQEKSLWQKIFGSKTENQVEEDFQAIKTELDQSKDQLQKQLTDIEEKQSKIDALSSENESLISSNNSISADLEEAKKEIALLKEQNDKLIAHNIELGGAKPAGTPEDGLQENGKDQSSKLDTPLTAQDRYNKILQEMDESIKE